MTTEYDPYVLQQYADDLYIQARFIIVRTALKYGFVAFFFSIVGSIIIARMMGPQDFSPDAAIAGVVMATVAGIVAGVDAGRREAFKLKLEAQQLLCQRQIERNTNTIYQGQRDRA